jgi:hypothetical protein
LKQRVENLNFEVSFLQNLGWSPQNTDAPIGARPQKIVQVFNQVMAREMPERIADRIAEQARGYAQEGDVNDTAHFSLYCFEYPCLVFFRKRVRISSDISTKGMGGVWLDCTSSFLLGG